MIPLIDPGAFGDSYELVKYRYLCKCGSAGEYQPTITEAEREWHEHRRAAHAEELAAHA